MKLVRFMVEKSIKYGLAESGGYKEVKLPVSDWSGAPLTFTGRYFDPSQVQILSPCAPSKVVCLGLNYRNHAKEVKLALPKKPIIFLKPSTAVIGTGAPIIYPPQSKRVDYEAELGVVMGRKAFRVSEDSALDYVFGYTCANDVTARDKQPAHGQWTYAKGFDTFCPLGPVIKTGIDNPENLRLKGYLNEELVQETSTADHLFSVAQIIAFVSGCMTLLPGDVILTGTPAGIGPLAPGDRYRVEIEEIGVLENQVRKAGDLC